MNIPHNDAEYRRAPAGIKARKLKKGFSSYEVLSNCLSAGEPYIAYGVTRYLVSIPDNGDSRWSRYGLLAL
ncbi:hypothetical protein FRC0151_02364 [Corynebacterium diphtheriae]|nr:hypothetical protein FRC0151_02364 [Corynebacterium diphtheriae]